LLQARECLKLDGTDEKKCQAKKYCTWSAVKKSCDRHTFEINTGDDRKGFRLYVRGLADLGSSVASSTSIVSAVT